MKNRTLKPSPDCSGILFCVAKRSKKDIAESGTGVSTKLKNSASKNN